MLITERVRELKDLAPTRLSLLSRLKNVDDNKSWQEFFETYWKLIYVTAYRAGLNDAESQDVVQDTIISVMKALAESKFSRVKGSFKPYLLRLTNWRIKDQFRKRQKEIDPFPRRASDSSTSSAIEFNQISHSVEPELEAAWNVEWESNLLEAAIDRVKRRVDPKHFQIFDLYVVKKWPVAKVAKAMSVSSARVYLIKHRVGAQIKSEVKKIQQKVV